jgi:hypothetical protein
MSELKLENNKEEKKLKNAIIIVGAPRSGTTIISEHVKLISQAVYFKKPNPIFRRVKKLFIKLGLKNKKDFLQKNISLDMTQEEFHNFLCKNVAPQYDPAGIFVEKRIANINLLPFLANQFIRPALIHIVRDPYNNVVSLLNQRKKEHGTVDGWWGVTPQGMPKKTGSPTVDCAMQYKYTHLLIQQSQDLFSNYTTINYKEYCADPQKTISTILDSLNLNKEVPEAPEPITFRENTVSSHVRNVVDDIIGEGFVNDLHREQ